MSEGKRAHWRASTLFTLYSADCDACQRHDYDLLYVGPEPAEAKRAADEHNAKHHPAPQSAGSDGEEGVG